MTRLLLALAVVICVACRREPASREETAHRDSALAPETGRDTASVAGELTAVGVDSLAARACESAAVIFSEMPGLVEAGSAPVADPDAGVDLAGCRVSLSGSFADMGGGQRPDVALGATFAATGWHYDDRWAADGPDGTSFLLRKDDRFCIVEGRWDGGVDGDPTYQPPPDFVLDVRCANRHQQKVEER